MAHAHSLEYSLVSTKYLREIHYLILKVNSFQFCGSNHLQTHGTAMGTKMAIAFANIFIARTENQTLRQSCIEPYPGHRRIFPRAARCFIFDYRPADLWPKAKVA